MTFPNKYSKTMSFSIRGFDFTFLKAKDPVKTLLAPAADLIHKLNDKEESFSEPTKESFHLPEKAKKRSLKITKGS